MLRNAAAVMLLGLIPIALAGEEPKSAKETSMAKSVHEFTVKDIAGKDVLLAKYKGDVVMIVNVASQCGYTDKSYAGLESIYKKYKDKGLKILAFPANNFGKQEPGTNSEIKSFCDGKGVTFELFEKISVKGDDKAPLYQYLTNHPNKEVAGEVPWNFTKYLVGRDGTVIAKWGPKTLPEDPSIVEALEKALAAERPKGGS